MDVHRCWDALLGACDMARPDHSGLHDGAAAAKDGMDIDAQGSAGASPSMLLYAYAALWYCCAFQRSNLDDRAAQSMVDTSRQRAMWVAVTEVSPAALGRYQPPSSAHHSITGAGLQALHYAAAAATGRSRPFGDRGPRPMR